MHTAAGIFSHPKIRDTRLAKHQCLLPKLDSCVSDLATEREIFRRREKNAEKTIPRSVGICFLNKREMFRRQGKQAKNYRSIRGYVFSQQKRDMPAQRKHGEKLFLDPWVSVFSTKEEIFRQGQQKKVRISVSPCRPRGEEKNQATKGTSQKERTKRKSKTRACRKQQQPESRATAPPVP